MESLFFKVGSVPNPNSNKILEQESVIVDEVTNINNGKTYEYRLIMKVKKEDGIRFNDNKEVSKVDSSR